MDPELKARLDAIEQKVEAAYQAANKTKLYMQWTAIITVALVVLPLIGLVFAIPSFLSTYSQISNLGAF